MKSSIVSQTSNKPTAIVNGYAIFAGGRDGSHLDTIDVFSVGSAGALIAVTQDSGIKLDFGRFALASAVVGNYAIFAGGQQLSSGSSSKSIDIFQVDPDTGTLTDTHQIVELSVARERLASAVLGNYVLFAGGISGGTTTYDVIDVYEVDPSTGALTNTENAVKLSVGRFALASAVVGNYVLFAGGDTGTAIGSNVIDVFKVNPNTGALTLVDNFDLSEGRERLTSAVVGNYVIFAGGRSEAIFLDTIDVFEVDTNTGALTPTGQDIKLSGGRDGLASAVIGNNVLFAGGMGNSGDIYDAIDVFAVDPDSGELTDIWGTGKLGVKRNSLASAVVGNYAIFAGGNTGSGVTSTIDVISIGVPTYELKYAFGDGDNPNIELPDDEVVEWGTEPELPTPETVPGYEFQGWTDDKKGFWEHLEDVPQTGSQILYAQYEEILTKRKERSNAKKHV
jgi:6-phosphogluconolactonase (cycloisomerase 2 family)